MVEETFETKFFFLLAGDRINAYEYGNSRRDRPLFVSLPLWNKTLLDCDVGAGWHD